MGDLVALALDEAPQHRDLGPPSDAREHIDGPDHPGLDRDETGRIARQQRARRVYPFRVGGRIGRFCGGLEPAANSED